MVRIPLEVIPGPEADDALRNAVGSLKGKLLVGTINSIGVRRDAKAVDPLSGQLKGQDADAASAAAVALGKIGDAASTKSLRAALAAARVKVRSAVAEGLVLCAERLMSQGDKAQAVEIYDEIRKADLPRQRKLEAMRGAIVARGDEGIPLLMEQFQSPEKAYFQLALKTSRELPGNKLDEVLATEVFRAAPERAARMIHAMADRKDTVVLAAVLKAAGGGPKEVRLAAVDALGRVGNASCLSPLLEIAIDPDKDLVEAAKGALSDLPGANVNKEVVARLATAEGKGYLVLIQLVGQRRIDAVDALVKALDDSDREVRNAALTSLGETVSPKDLAVLVAQVVAPKHAGDVPSAQAALKTAAIRMPDREACAAELAAAIDKAPLPTKSVLLEIIGEVGGTKALAAVAAAAKSNEDELKDTSSRLLGKWMTIDAAPVLFELSQNGPADKYQVRAVRGYIRIARQFTMEEPQRIEMCKNSLKIAHLPAEKGLMLDVLKRYPNFETLKMALNMAHDVPELKAEASQAALTIVQKLGTKSDDVRAEVLAMIDKADLGTVKLEIDKAEYGSGATQKDVTAAIQKQASDKQLILLPSTYNDLFGGDPLPGTAKQLKIKYKINDRPGEASFAENNLIVLPMPK